MFGIKWALFSCLSLYIVGANANVVSFIEPCAWNDKECLMKSSKIALPYVCKGIPELGMSSLDPMHIKSVNLDNGDMKLQMSNMTITGICQCIIVNIERVEKLKIVLTLECPIKSISNYVLGGKFYVLDVFGNSKCEIKTAKLRLDATIDLAQFEKDGVKYYKVAKFDYSYTPIEKVHIKFDELNNDDATADPVRKILDENWKEIMLEIAKPVIKEVCVHSFKNANKMISQILCNEFEKS